MSQFVRSQTLPACTCCHADRLLTLVDMPKTDAYGRRIQLELCKDCDAGKPAAAAVIAFFATGGGHDLSRAEEGSRLMMEWTKEGISAYGWHWEETPTATTDRTGTQGRADRVRDAGASLNSTKRVSRAQRNT
ncbi:DUF6300 family protein [Streptomyces sp. MMBL 11-3]|uniref:DUF6300 family protein n=1 Tax=Streptomyces sp. MMBL 11-3 TaxID=3382639 RepID=UPI0039B4164E